LTERSLVTSTPSSGTKPPNQRTSANVVHGGSGRYLSAGEGAEGNDDNHFTLIVHRTLNDVSRRKKNVVVSGIVERSSDAESNDKEAFEELCERHLLLKPQFAAGNCCVRIGKQQQDGRPRRLLVKLQTEETAAALLEVAPSLRYSSDEFIAANVYINPDLSPSAAKLAYEARLKRREHRTRHSMPASHAKTADVNIPCDEQSTAASASAAVYKGQLSDNCVRPIASTSTSAAAGSCD